MLAGGAFKKKRLHCLLVVIVWEHAIEASRVETFDCFEENESSY